MKILLIPHISHYRDWKGKTYHDILIHFQKNSKHEIKILWLDKERFDPKNTELIIFFTTDSIQNIAKKKVLDKIFDNNIPKIYSALDMFYFNLHIICPYLKKCQGIIHFSYASNMLSSYQEHFPNFKIQSLSARFVNTEKYKNYNLEKKYDILIYGSRKIDTGMENYKPDLEYKKLWEKKHGKKLGEIHSFYPLRERMENLLKKNKHKYNLKILPAACIFNATIANEDLSKLINQSYLTLCTSSRADIAMAKYFEVGCSNSAILGNIPTDYKNIFKDHIIEITEWMDDDEIIKNIDMALSNKKKLLEKIKISGCYFSNNFNLKKCTDELDNCVNKYNIK